MPISSWFVVAFAAQALETARLQKPGSLLWLDVLVASVGLVLIALAMRRRRG